MNEKDKMYTSVVATVIGTITVAGALAYATISDNVVGSSDTDSIKQQMGISEDISIDEYFANREENGQIEDTESKNTEEIAVNEEFLDSMPTVETTVDKKQAEGNLENLKGEIPQEVNLEVTFYAQAPDANWSLPWKEACEEASIAQAYHFVMGDNLTKTKFKEDIIELTALGEKIYGAGRVDTNIEETAHILEEYYNYTDYEIIENPTIAQLKGELAQGHPIVAPFAGKELGNSFFTDGGPRFHMLVIVGYNEEFFLTNDVGTSRGENFTYSYDTIIEAMHDFVPKGKDITQGAKKVLVLR